MEWISGPRPSGLRSGCALPAPGRTRPAPAEALRCPESPDNLHTEGTTAVPGPDPRRPGAADHAFRPFPQLGLRPRCGNGRCCTSEWKWGTYSLPRRGTLRSLCVPVPIPSLARNTIIFIRPVSVPVCQGPQCLPLSSCGAVTSYGSFCFRTSAGPFDTPESGARKASAQECDVPYVFSKTPSTVRNCSPGAWPSTELSYT